MVGSDDLNQGSEMKKLLAGALKTEGDGYYFQHDATDPKVRALSRLEYNNKLRKAMKQLVDNIAQQ